MREADEDGVNVYLLSLFLLIVNTSITGLDIIVTAEMEIITIIMTLILVRKLKQNYYHNHLYRHFVGNITDVMMVIMAMTNIKVMIVVMMRIVMIKKKVIIMVVNSNNINNNNDRNENNIN